MIDLSLNKVTPLSKALASLLFITLPFVGFWVGVKHSSNIDESKIMEEKVSQDLDNDELIDVKEIRELGNEGMEGIEGKEAKLVNLENGVTRVDNEGIYFVMPNKNFKVSMIPKTDYISISKFNEYGIIFNDSEEWEVVCYFKGTSCYKPNSEGVYIALRNGLGENNTLITPDGDAGYYSIELAVPSPITENIILFETGGDTVDSSYDNSKEELEKLRDSIKYFQ